MEFFHVSPSKNRGSILIYGLEPRVQEDLNIRRSPAVYMFETKEQADEWAFWAALEKNVAMDIWSVFIQDVTLLKPDTHPEMQKDFNSWKCHQTISIENLNLIDSVTPKRVADAPKPSNRIKSRLTP